MSINDVTRWVLVDDTDSRIQYSATGWFSDQGGRDLAGTSGPPYQSTLYGTKGNASASFAFIGSRVRVIGSSDVRNISGVVDPSWDCFIDNISISTSTPAKTSQNNWVFCEQEGLSEGIHSITVNAIVLQEQTFWLDQIRYAPSTGVPLNAESILISNEDSSLRFSNGWKSFAGNNTSITNTPNTSLSFSFFGVSLTWYGFISTSYPRTATTGSYSIDGGEGLIFPLRGLLSNSNKTSNDNQIFFQTNSYPPGVHNITVTYLGDQNTVPLTLDRIVVRNGTVSDFATYAGSSRSSQFGQLVGGIVGGLVLLILVSVIFLLYFRRKNRSKHRKQEGDREDISGPSIVEPFRGDPTLPKQSSPIARIIAKTAHRRTFPNLTTTEPESTMPPGQSSPRTFPKRSIQRPPSASTNDGINISSSRRVVRHEDSGARFPGDIRESEVVELPPVYTDV